MSDTTSPVTALPLDQRIALERRLMERRASRQPSNRIPAHDSAREIPLTFGQQRLWFLQQLDPHSTAYRVSLALRMSGPLRVDALERAVTTIVARHGALRTVFGLRPSGPVQVVQPPAPVTLEHFDLTATALEDREQRVVDVASEFAARPFDLERGPVFRAGLIAVNATEHVLVVSIHHIVSDIWSLGVFVRELSALYAAPSTDPAEALPPVATTFADYACWQRDRLQGAVLQTELDFWRQQLSGVTPHLELPTDFRRPALPSYRGGRVNFDLPAATIAALRQLSRQHDTTLFTTLTAALNILLCRYTGQTDLLLGFAIAGRHRAEIEPVIGLFVNTLILRSDLSGDPTFTALLSRMRETSLNAFAHQDAPFEMLVQEFQPERDLSRNPLFQVLVGVQNVPNRQLTFGDLEVELVELTRNDTHVDLTLFVTEDGDTAKAILEYNADVFERSTVERMAGHYRVLLDAIAARPDLHISALPILSDEERRLLTTAPTPFASEASDTTIVARFESVAARYPDATAVAWEDARVSYAELNARANQLARALVAAGVGPESKVALFLERSVDTVVAILAALKAGGGYVPLELSYPQDRLAFMLADSAPAVVLTQASLRAQLPATSAAVVCVDSDAALISTHTRENLGVRIEPSQLAYVIYTSGSTGRPKGVQVTHDNVGRLLDATAQWFQFGPEDVWSLFHSFAFDFSVWELWGPLLTGGRVVVVPYVVSRSPDAFLELLRREGVTVLNQTPSAFRQLAQADEAAGTPALRLRTVIFGGEALDFQSLTSWFERRGDSMPQLINMYGITETTVHVTYRPVTMSDAQTSPGSLIGAPIPDLQVHILDRRGEPVPIGVAGEICVGGRGVARGYLGRPELTAERFVPDPYAITPGARLYRSGDLARRLANGDVQYLGRMDDQVKIRGFRIELGEIQQVLAGHPAVRDAVVIPREFGPGDTRLVAYLTPDPQHAAPLREVMRLEADGALPSSKRHELPNGMTVAHLNRNETEFLFGEVFEDHSYLRHGVGIPDGACVFDVGANIGMFTLFAARQACNVRVFAFEPIPQVFELLQLNARVHGVDARLLNAGAAEQDGQATFQFYPNVSIFSGRFADAAHERETVTRFVQNQQGPAALAGTSAALLDELLTERLEMQAVDCSLATLSTVIRQHGVTQIDLLKIDVEKSELQVLRGLREDDWPKVRQAIIEVHDEDGRLAEIVGLLERRGFATVVEQETQLAGTDLHTVYATRAGERSTPVTPPAPQWSSASRLVADVKAAARQRLPEYMVPQAIVLLDQLPLTSNGKLDRRALPAPDVQRTDSPSPEAAPHTDAERTLVDIWTRVLKTARVGIHDNFFELGGDSILSIQVIAAANSAGLRLTPRHMFQHPTIAELASVAGTVALSPTAEDRPDGEVPLTPIQHWFFEQRFADAHHFNQAVLLRSARRIDARALDIAMQHVIEHHDALRLRFDGGELPVQRYVPVDGRPIVDDVDITSLPQADVPAMVERVANERQASLHLTDGPLVRVTLFNRREGGDSYLLIVIHHLVVDGVSWRIILEDLALAYQHAQAGERSEFPPKTASYKRWSEHLRDYAESDAAREQTRFWAAALPAAAAPLPVDTPGGANSLASSGRAITTLSVEESRALIHDVPKALGTQIDDLLLTALSRVLTEWTGGDTALVHVERHGREQLAGDDVDLSRTVGWFTAFVPLALKATPQMPLDVAIKEIKEMLRRLPDRGAGFGIVKYLSRDPEVRRLVESLPHPQVSFNYQGQFGGADGEWALASGLSTGANRSGAGHRAHLLEIDSMVVGGQLRAVWTYGRELHRPVTIERLAVRFGDALRALIEHARGSAAPAFTPSDFPAARVSQDELDKLIAKIGSRRTDR